MKELRDRDIHLMFCRITRETDKMISCFEGHYNDNIKHELISKDLFGAEEVSVFGGKQTTTHLCVLEPRYRLFSFCVLSG